MRSPEDWAGDLKTMAGGYFFPLIDRTHAAELITAAVNERLDKAETEVRELLALLKVGDLAIALAAERIQALKLTAAAPASEA